MSRGVEAAAPPLLPAHRLTFALALFTLATSAIVFREPAPYDALILLVGGLALVFHMFSYERAFAAPFLCVLAFLAANVIAMLAAPSEVFGGYVTKSVGYFLVTSYLAVSYLVIVGLLGAYGRRAMRLLMLGYTVSGSIATTLGLAAFFHVIPNFDRLVVVGRVTGTFKDPNVYGPFLVPLLLFALVRIEETSRRYRPLWIAALLLNFVGVVLCYSRAAWGNTVLAIATYIGLRLLGSRDMRQVRGMLVKSAIAVVVLVVVGALLLQRPGIGELFFSRLSIQYYDKDRFGTQAKGLQAVLSSPLGLGPGLAESAFGYATHSLFVRVLAENGMIGSAAILVLLLRTLAGATYRALTSDPDTQRYAAMAAAATCGLLLNSAFVDTLHWRHFWIILALPWMAPVASAAHLVRASGRAWRSMPDAARLTQDA